jgi:predicted O-linked N-acetylglucosamine transferase (SPINDLY family)
LRPQYLEALHNLGNALHGLGRPEEAVACFRQVLQLRPDYAEAYNDLGAALIALGLMQEAEHSYRRALQIRPDDAKTRHGLLVALNYRSDEPLQVFREHLTWAERQAATTQPDTVHRNPPDPDRRLRIGYVSPDFRTHSVAFFAVPLLTHHDPAAVETYGYANVAHADATTAQLQSRCHHWRDVHAMPDDQLADRIRQDGIDILVDLAGHTAGNRLAVFARKPAPIQVTYLGYPNTTGLSTIDYRLTDALADPPGTTEQWHTEKLVRLPEGFLCYAPPPNAPAVAPLPAATNGYITFGSFNNLAKVTPKVVELWARILKAIPGSRLEMKGRLLKEPETRERVLRQFDAHGIGRERVDLVPNVPGMANHLAYYHRLDLALDTFPYNGTTTTCEALWMGVPVITLAGRTHAGRVGVSLLTRVGLPELIAENEDDYVQRAVTLARDPERLAALRAGLRPRMTQSPLCDGPSFARHVEAAYREMWRGWCAGGRKI